VEGSDASGDKTVGGKHAGDIELRSRVNATTTDSQAGELCLPGKGFATSRRMCYLRNRMRKSCTSGSVGAPGEQSPGATRPQDCTSDLNLRLV